MKQSKFLQIAGFMIALLSLTTQSTWAQTTVTLPAACANCPTAPDADGDGVPDATDACPGTPAGTPVDATGCPAGPAFPAGYVPCDGVTTVVQDVTSALSGRIWMDRNLGASRAALTIDDVLAFGDLYQWGRFAEGHQCRTSNITTTLATTAVPNAGNPWDGLIIEGGPNWLTTEINSLWQGVNGTNNPCPSGYRLPTIAEWSEEGIIDYTDAFSSPLKLIMASINGSSHTGNYWSSSVDSSGPYYLFFQDTNSTVGPNSRVNRLSVRCIKN